MSNWNEFCSNVTRVANKTISKTEELAETASMHVKLRSLQSKRDELYEKLGKLTYKQLKAGLDMADEIAGMVADIDAVKSDIAAQKAKIEKAKEDKARAKEEQKKAKAEAEAQAEQECVTEVKVIIENNK
ncbi:MAG: hypothetical protein IJY08_00635 [Clostridia bacterium]|nr:hypothetical protein [Clostridia bacterium]